MATRFVTTYPNVPGRGFKPATRTTFAASALVDAARDAWHYEGLATSAGEIWCDGVLYSGRSECLLAAGQLRIRATDRHGKAAGDSFTAVGVCEVQIGP